MKCVVVGLGGIGSALVDPLARFLNFWEPKETHRLLLIDGDIYEPKNLERQAFDEEGIEVNKAEYHADRLTNLFERLSVSFSSEFINMDNVSEYIDEGNAVFGCLDNHATRKVIQEHCLLLNNSLYISGGNELYDGNVQVHQRIDGEDITVPIWTMHEEIKYPTDKSPEDMSCQELMSVEPQLLFTNFMVAAMMLNAFFVFKDRKGKAPYSEVYFDILENKTRPLTRKA